MFLKNKLFWLIKNLSFAIKIFKSTFKEIKASPLSFLNKASPSQLSKYYYQCMLAAAAAAAAGLNCCLEFQLRSFAL